MNATYIAPSQGLLFTFLSGECNEYNSAKYRESNRNHTKTLFTLGFNELGF